MSHRRTLVSGTMLFALLVALVVIERSLVRQASAQQTVQAPRFEVDPFWP